MSCGCDSGYDDGAYGICVPDIPYPNVSHESVPSLMDNLVSALYGTFFDPTTQTGYIKKYISNGKIVWDIPCDPSNTASIPGVDRYQGEGLLCYILRVFQSFNPASYISTTATQTLTNKTYASPIFTGPFTLPAGAGTAGQVLFSGGPSADPYWANNSSSATTATNLSGGSAGTLPYQTGPGATAMLAAGTSGQFLKSNGTAAPSWATPTIATATNLSGTTVNSIPYQSASATTSYLSPGASGQYLQSNGSSSAPSWSSLVIPLPNRNLIQNGGMTVDQRRSGNSFSLASASTAFALDRWLVKNTPDSGTFTATVGQNSLSGISAPQGFSSYLGITNTGANSSAGFVFGQNLDLDTLSSVVGGSSAAPLSLSFYVYSSVTGTYGGSIYLSGSDANVYIYVFEYSISSANTWSKITLSNIPGYPAAITKTSNANIIFSLGSTAGQKTTPNVWITQSSGVIGYTSSVNETNWASNSGSVFGITAVQFEASPVATPFENTGFSKVLLDCQKYYESSYYLSGPPFGAASVPGTAAYYAGAEYLHLTGLSSATYVQKQVTYKATKAINRSIAPFIFSPFSGTISKVYDIVASADVSPSGIISNNSIPNTLSSRGSQTGFALSIPQSSVSTARIIFHWVIDVDISTLV